MILALPDFRQKHDFDCGGAVCRSVAAFFGVGIDSAEQCGAALGTDCDGTHVDAIADYLRSFGLRVYAVRGMTLRELREQTTPVICLVQSEGAGHYVVALGVDVEHVHLQDPWSGRVRVPIEEFSRDWHDAGELHLGIIVGQRD